ncbi:MAG TPA: hypothetical protein VMR00_05355 [Streptosporangiaceae bacterium]|nr:hypothetical protein [Streptosporangiaceae bacterium]
MFSTDRRYRIIVRGECGQLLTASFEDAVVEPAGGFTSIIAVIHDDSALYGLLDQIQNLALHLISINEIGCSESADSSGAPS